MLTSTRLFVDELYYAIGEFRSAVNVAERHLGYLLVFER